MSDKKKLGIVGGMGSRAGVFLLQKVIDYSPAEKDQEFLEIIFHNNADIPDRTRAIINNEASPVNAILKSIEFFNDNQVEVIVLACITSYFYFNQISACTSAHIVNPLTLISKSIINNYPGTKRIGVLATTGTLNSRMFHNELGRAGFEVITLDAPDQENVFMRSIYMKNGFKSACISPDAKVLMHQSFQMLKAKNVDIIIGGCTEISVAVSSIPTVISDIAFIDMLDLLAINTVNFCYNR